MYANCGEICCSEADKHFPVSGLQALTLPREQHAVFHLETIEASLIFVNLHNKECILEHEGLKFQGCSKLA